VSAIKVKPAIPNPFKNGINRACKVADPDQYFKHWPRNPPMLGQLRERGT